MAGESAIPLAVAYGDVRPGGKPGVWRSLAQSARRDVACVHARTADRRLFVRAVDFSSLNPRFAGGRDTTRQPHRYSLDRGTRQIHPPRWRRILLASRYSDLMAVCVRQARG